MQQVDGGGIGRGEQRREEPGEDEKSEKREADGREGLAAHPNGNTLERNRLCRDGWLGCHCA